MEGRDASQRWQLSQAQQLTTAVVGSRWLLVEREVFGIAAPLLILVVFWLCVLFMSFGLFAPRNATVTVALLLCALVVAGAIQMTLDLSWPFEGFVRLSGGSSFRSLQPSRQASWLALTSGTCRPGPRPSARRSPWLNSQPTLDLLSLAVNHG